MEEKIIFGLLIPTFNRPELVAQTLKSIDKTVYPEGFDEKHICIVDDGSTDLETIRVIAEWQPSDETIRVHRLMLRENQNMFNSMEKGFKYLLNTGCNLLCNLDSDTIVRRDWLTKMYELQRQFPQSIVSGFNCSPEIQEPGSRPDLGYVFKMVVGGMSMLFSRELWDLYYKDCFQAKDGKLQWDWKACNTAYITYKQHVAVTWPSVVQHMGTDKNPSTAPDFIPDSENETAPEVKASEKPTEPEEKYDADIIIVSDGKTEALKQITEKAIQTARDSEPKKKLNIIVVESADVDYGKDLCINYSQPDHTEIFNYNHALNQALSFCKSDISVFCNNDLEFNPGWFTELKKAMKKAKAGAGSPINPNEAAQQKVKAAAKPATYVEGYEVRKEFSGWCFALTKQSIETIKEFPETVDFWMSDNITVELLKNFGIKHVLCFKSQVAHLESPTLKSLIPEARKVYTVDQWNKYEKAKELIKVHHLEIEARKQRQIQETNKATSEITPKSKPQVAVPKKGGKPVVFAHCGFLSYIIYSLPVVKALTDNAVIYLETNFELGVDRGVSLSDAHANAIKPLLLAQDYISEVHIVDRINVRCDYNLGDIRRIKMEQGDNLCEKYLNFFSLPVGLAQDKWLTAEPTGIPAGMFGQVTSLCSRSLYDHNSNIGGGAGWAKFFDNTRVASTGFIGTGEEYNKFNLNFGRKISHIQTPDLLKAAQYIASSDTFSANACVNYAIAEGLKHPNLVLEINSDNDFIHIKRAQVFAV